MAIREARKSLATLVVSQFRDDLAGKLRRFFRVFLVELV